MTEIYGVTGMPLAGKTTVARLLEDEGFSVLDMGEVVRKEMEKRDKDVSETGEFVNDLREENGMDAIAQLSVPYLEVVLEEKEKVVITGMRGWDEKERFEKETGEEVEIIAVWTSRDERKRRREERQREEDIEGDGFHERDIRETKYGVAKLMALSDHMIKNDTITEDELGGKVKGLIDEEVDK
jgi:dephospho-CoA kinase